jgi:hypothetical protein
MVATQAPTQSENKSRPSQVTGWRYNPAQLSIIRLFTRDLRTHEYRSLDISVGSCNFVVYGFHGRQKQEQKRIRECHRFWLELKFATVSLDVWRRNELDSLLSKRTRTM